VARRPDPRAQLMALTAIVLDGARVDPQRRPPERLIEWQREIAIQLGVLPRHPATFRELLDGALRLHRILKGFPDPLRDGPPVESRPAAPPAEATRVSLAS
jgi:hypothetical protein